MHASIPGEESRHLGCKEQNWAVQALAGAEVSGHNTVEAPTLK